MLFTIPNLLSASRIILGCFIYQSIVNDHWYFAVTLLWTAIATDMLDGFLARKQENVTPFGGLVDHGSDAIFVTLCIAAHTTHGWAPPLLALIIPAAFIQYMLDSKAIAGHPLRTSQLGRYNGLAYFVFAGFPIMQLTLQITLIPFHLFVWVGWGLVLTTAISMLDRLFTLLSQRPVDD